MLYVGPDPFNQALAATLLNPDAAGWSPAAAPDPAPAPPLAALATDSEIKVVVGEAGLYKLTYSALQSAGLPAASDPNTFKLRHGYPRQEVAIRQFSDHLLFYAQPEFSRYTDEDVYFLTYGGDPGLRMTSRSGAANATGIARRTATAEVNQHYDPYYPGRDGDHWYWDKLVVLSNNSGTYPIQLEAPRTDVAATLTVWLQSYTDPAQNPDHKVTFSVNGTHVGTRTWNGAQAINATFSVSGSLLKNGTNQVTLTLPGVGTDIEGTWVDAIAMTYATGQAGSNQMRFQGEANKKYTLTNVSPPLSVYDVTDPAKPKVVTGYTPSGSTLTVKDVGTTAAIYLVVPDNRIKTSLALKPSRSLSDPAGGADYIIITHPDLAAAIGPLASHRAAQGLRVVTVDVEAIYDAFGPGRLDPEAIKNFLQHAYTNWNGTEPPPEYVLLVGDGSYDFKNHSGHNPATLIPPYLAWVDPYWGETASDNLLVTIVGGGHLPDMLIGRLSVNTGAETATVVNKIIQYENAAFTQLWYAYQLVVSDNPDGFSDFHAVADKVYSAIKSPFTGLRMYFSTAASQPHMFTDASVLKDSLLHRFSGGVSLVTFIGHASWHQWSPDNLFHLDDISQLSNQYRMPIVVELTCFTGYFHHPQYPTLDESLLRKSGGGAVGVWGSTGLGDPAGHSILQQGFYDALTNPETDVTLGAATLAGKMAATASGFNGNLADTYTLFGDPALNLRFNSPSSLFDDFPKIFMPVITRH